MTEYTYIHSTLSSLIHCHNGFILYEYPNLARYLFSKIRLWWESFSCCMFNVAAAVFCPGFPHSLESTWIFFILNSRYWKYLKTGQVL